MWNRKMSWLASLVAWAEVAEVAEIAEVGEEGDDLEASSKKKRQFLTLL